MREIDEINAYVHVDPAHPRADTRVFLGEKLRGPSALLLDAKGKPVPDEAALLAARPVLTLFETHAIVGKFRPRVPLHEAARRICESAHRVGAHDVIGDIHLSYALEGECAARDLAYRTLP